MPRNDGKLYPWEERALKTAHRKVPMSDTGKGICRWCERTIIGRRGKYLGKPDRNRSWCRDATEGRDCWFEFELHSRAEAQASYLFGRDGPRCQGCGHGGYASAGTFTVKPDGMTWEAYFNADKTDWPRYTILKPATELEVDHIVPLWRVALLTDLTFTGRRWYFGPGNLQLLCKPCHKAKCRTEAAERAAIKRAAAAAAGGTQGTLPLGQ
jgi:hypothetical protein